MRIISLAWGGVSKRRLYALALDQAGVIAAQRAEITHMELEHARHTRDLIASFTEALDEPNEDALRYALAAGFSDLCDHVARLEEHAG